MRIEGLIAFCGLILAQSAISSVSAMADDPGFGITEDALKTADHVINSTLEDAPAGTETTWDVVPPLENQADYARFYEKNLHVGQYAAFTPIFDPQKGPTRITRFASDEDLLNYVKNRSGPVGNSSWLFSMYPNYEVRKLGYDELISLISDGNWFTEDSKALLNDRNKRVEFLKNPNSSFTTSITADFSGPSFSSSALGFDSQLKDSQIVKWLACLQYAPRAPLSCSRALDYVVETMKPNGNLTAVPLLKKIIEDPRYAEGASRAAIKLMSKVDASVTNRALDVGDLFTDILESYIEIGESQQKAEQMAWDLLGVYGARGANISSLFPYASGKAGGRTLLALQTITSAAGVLDEAAHGTGHLYSIPKQIITVAEYGKPYHFWMSAYLSREVALKFGSEEGARGATQITELAYQMFSVTAGRENAFNTILTRGIFSPLANKLRTDFGFAFAGATFGSKAAFGRISRLKINVDEVIKAMIEKAPKLRSWTAEKLARYLKNPLKKFLAYFRWTRIIRPSVAKTTIQHQAACRELLITE